MPVGICLPGNDLAHEVSRSAKILRGWADVDMTCAGSGSDRLQWEPESVEYSLPIAGRNQHRALGMEEEWPPGPAPFGSALRGTARSGSNCFRSWGRSKHWAQFILLEVREVITLEITSFSVRPSWPRGYGHCCAQGWIIQILRMMKHRLPAERYAGCVQWPGQHDYPFAGSPH